MSVVNTETGEVLDLDRAAAERRAERIRLRLDTIADNYAAVMPMIRESIEKRDDVALGYASVGAYVADRFGGSLQRLGVEVRRAVVAELEAAGMSTRAIARVVGVSDMTVRRDQQLGATHVAPAETPVGEGDSASGADDPAPTEATSGVNRPQDYPAAPAPAPRPPVIGIDGKTYPRPTPVAGRARPRPPAERSLNSIAIYADKAAREAQTLTADQIRRVRTEADHWTAGLRNSIEVLQHLVDSLQPKETK